MNFELHDEVENKIRSNVLRKQDGRKLHHLCLGTQILRNRFRPIPNWYHTRLKKWRFGYHTSARSHASHSRHRYRKTGGLIETRKGLPVTPVATQELVFLCARSLQLGKTYVAGDRKTLHIP